MCSDWEKTVLRLSQQLSKGLGLAYTEGIEASLQNISLIADCSYHVNSKEDVPPGTFATMLVLLLPADTVCLVKIVVN